MSHELEGIKWEVQELKNIARELSDKLNDLSFIANIADSLSAIVQIMTARDERQEDKFVLNVHQVLHDEVGKLELENRRLKEQLAAITEQGISNEPHVRSS